MKLFVAVARFYMGNTGSDPKLGMLRNAIEREETLCTPDLNMLPRPLASRPAI